MKESNKRKWVVTIYNRYDTSEKKEVEVVAETQDEAEELAVSRGLICREEGWFVEDSRPIFKIGDKVRWHDPEIDEYPENERELARNRVFEIFDIYTDEDDEENDDAIICISDGTSEAEVYESELELVTETPLKVVANIYKRDIKSAEQLLIDNGVDEEEAEAVLQALGHNLLGVELYGNEKSIELHNATL